MSAKIISIILIAIVSALMFLSAGTANKSAPAVVYVYSDSMEPVINVDDGFVVLPSTAYNEGDIIVFRPVKLDAQYITHRIYSQNENGYITKGDNSPYTDQEAGEPEVAKERIIGKAAVINGRLLKIGGFGRFVELLDRFNLRAVALIFVVAGVIASIFTTKRKRKSRIRLRIRHVYKGIIIVFVLLAIVSGIFGAKTEDIRYLVTDGPGSREDHVAVNSSGRMELTIRNKGPFPLWLKAEPLSPIENLEQDKFIKPFSQGIIEIELPEKDIPGWYQGYVKVYFYPVLMPYNFIMFFHKISFYAAVIINAGVFFLLMFFIVRGINYLGNNEEFLPVKIFRNKKFRKRFKRAMGTKIIRRRII